MFNFLLELCVDDAKVTNCGIKSIPDLFSKRYNIKSTFSSVFNLKSLNHTRPWGTKSHRLPSHTFRPDAFNLSPGRVKMSITRGTVYNHHPTCSSSTTTWDLSFSNFWDRFLGFLIEIPWRERERWLRMRARPLITGALEKPPATPVPEPPQVQFWWSFSSVSFSWLSLVGGTFFFRGDCGDIRLSIGCDQNEVTGCWSTGSSSLGEER